MFKLSQAWIVILCVIVAFLAGRWLGSSKTVKAESGSNPQVEIRQIAGDSSLAVYYPDLRKIFIYQNPFVGLPKWSCAYSVQLSTPGGTIERQPCAAASSAF